MSTFMSYFCKTAKYVSSRRMWPDHSTGNNLFERGKYLCPVQDDATEEMPASWIQSGFFQMVAKQGISMGLP
jgi:hypothetical protein